MEKDTIFRLYSMTKPIAATALMMLYEEGRFQMRDPLSKYLPELANLHVLRDPDGAVDDTVPMQRAPTVQDVLRHTAGFTHGLESTAIDALYSKANLFGVDVSLEEMIEKLSRMPLQYQPGTKWVYSVGPDIQARLVEVLSGMPFDEFVDKRIFQPLGMRDAGFWVRPERAARLATVYWSKDGKLTPLDEIHGHPQPGFGWLSEPWSVNSYNVNHKRKGGSYGLLSTAEDYFRFAQAMLNRGEFDGTRILSPQVVGYMVRDHLGAIGMRTPDQMLGGIGFGLGFGVIEDPALAGDMSGVGSFFWEGAAATSFWIDPQQDMVVVAMTQLMSAPAADALRAQLSTLVYSALLQ
jgi:CubicO group peptidase (beta-lactamase class C family)